jgi:hypothetical protein
MRIGRHDDESFSRSLRVTWNHEIVTRYAAQLATWGKLGHKVDKILDDFSVLRGLRSMSTRVLP